MVCGRSAPLTGQACSSSALAGSQSAPALGRHRQLHHRGENAFGSVRGFDQAGDEVYVPRAMWTASMASPLKNRCVEFDPSKYESEERDQQRHRRSMTTYLNKALNKQVQERTECKRQAEVEDQEIFRATLADLKKKEEEDLLEKDAFRQSRKVFVDGLAKQVAHHSKKVAERRRQEDLENENFKLRTTQQFVQEMIEVARRKDEHKQELETTLRSFEQKSLQKRAERKKENQEIREAFSKESREGDESISVLQKRLKDTVALQEVIAARFNRMQGREDAERFARETGRQDRDERHHQLRTDMMFAQRELARDRQKQHMRQSLEDQVEAKQKRSGITKIEQEYDKQIANAACRSFLEEEVLRVQKKRSEELKNQASLIEQMREKQERMKAENGPFHKPPAALSTMQVTESLLAIGQVSRRERLGSPDLMCSLDAPLYLSKPCGKMERFTATPVAGARGSIADMGGSGHTGLRRDGRSLARSNDVAGDRRFKKKWSEGLTVADFKVGRQVAAKRWERSVADKSLA